MITNELYTTEEQKDIHRLLLNGHGDLKAELRTCGSLGLFGGVGVGRAEYVHLDDMIHFLTDLMETSLEDNKSEAYKGLRLVLRGLKRRKNG